MYENFGTEPSLSYHYNVHVPCLNKRAIKIPTLPQTTLNQKKKMRVKQIHHIQKILFKSIKGKKIQVR